LHLCYPLRAVERQLHLPDVDIAIERQCIGADRAVIAEIPGCGTGCSQGDRSNKDNDDFSLHCLYPR